MTVSQRTYYGKGKRLGANILRTSRNTVFVLFGRKAMPMKTKSQTITEKIRVDVFQRNVLCPKLITPQFALIRKLAISWKDE